MLAGDMYDAGDAELMAMRLTARQRCQQFNNLPPGDKIARGESLKTLFGSTGESLYIEPNFHCDYGCNIHVGEQFYANFDCVILDVAEVRFGDNVLIAGNPAKLIKHIDPDS